MDCVCAHDSILNVQNAHLRPNRSALLATKSGEPSGPKQAQQLSMTVPVEWARVVRSLPRTSPWPRRHMKIQGLRRAACGTSVTLFFLVWTRSTPPESLITWSARFNRKKTETL